MRANFILFLFSLLVSATPLFVFAQNKDISSAVKALVSFETRANAAAVRSSQMVKIENYEIPIELARGLFSSRFDLTIANSIMFKRDGKTYVRWIINPEDGKWYKEVEQYLKKNGVSTERHQYFKGYQTASRSYIVVDPNSGVQFSVKVSTNRTGGAWKDKKQTFEDAKQIRLIDDYVLDVFAKFPPKYFTYLDEPAVFGLEEIDQGMIIRSLNELPNETSGKFYVPGFSVLHEKIGEKIAQVNGSNNPAQFWEDNYNLPLARALAELAARTGVVYDSPHSQNFLVEMDLNMKPTGRIILRDLGDAYISREFVTAMGRADVAEFFEPENVIDGKLPVWIGLLHGNQNPSWIKDALYKKWGREFFIEFNKTFVEIAKIERTDMPLRYEKKEKYFVERISMTANSLKAYLDRIRKEVTAQVVAPLKCQSVFQN